MKRVVAVVGASGFVGSAVAEHLAVEYEVRRLVAPRLQVQATSISDLRAAVDLAAVDAYAEQYLVGVNLVVNAAGLATATATHLPALLGANAVLPLFLAEAAHRAQADSYVHVSSAAVQGRGLLTESEDMRPENPYAVSKALGEVLLRRYSPITTVRYRPTSVHGTSRPITRSLVKVARSPVAVVAGPGDDPSPQMPIARLAEAVALVGAEAGSAPEVVLHPWEGATTETVMSVLGGKDPKQLPRTIARSAVAGAYATARIRKGLLGHARRLDMLLFGQEQAAGWLASRLGPRPSAQAWLKSLADSMSVPDQEEMC